MHLHICAQRECTKLTGRRWLTAGDQRLLDGQNDLHRTVSALHARALDALDINRAGEDGPKAPTLLMANVNGPIAIEVAPQSRFGQSPFARSGERSYFFAFRPHALPTSAVAH
jgi:hypothetical protein